MPYVTTAIVTPWVGTGVSGDPLHPYLNDVHSVIYFTDYTGLPVPEIVPDPNTNTILAVFDSVDWPTVEADPQFAPIWSEEFVEESDAIGYANQIAAANPNV